MINLAVVLAVVSILVGQNYAVIHTKLRQNYTEHVHLRHGVFFNMINSVHFVDEGFEFYVRINFLPFFETKMALEKMVNLHYNENIKEQLYLSTQKLDSTIQKLFSFVYTILDEEKKITTPAVISSFNFTSHRKDVIDELLGLIWPPMTNHVNSRLANDNITSKLLIEQITNQIEMDVLTFMLALTEAVQSKRLTSYLIPLQVLQENVLQKLTGFEQITSKPMLNFHKSEEIFAVYNLCQVEKIYYNTATSSLLFRISFPVYNQERSKVYKIYEIVPIFTPLDNVHSIKLDYPMKYLAVSVAEDEYMTFNDYNCRYVSIFDKILCRDQSIHIMANEYDCINSIFRSRTSNLCQYIVSERQTIHEFINIGRGIWFYSIKDGQPLQITQICSDESVRNEKTHLASQSCGVLIFKSNCFGTFADNSYRLMSIDRRGTNKALSVLPFSVSSIPKPNLQKIDNISVTSTLSPAPAPATAPSAALVIVVICLNLVLLVSMVVVILVITRCRRRRRRRRLNGRSSSCRHTNSSSTTRRTRTPVEETYLEPSSLPPLPPPPIYQLPPALPATAAPPPPPPPLHNCPPSPVCSAYYDRHGHQRTDSLSPPPPPPPPPTTTIAATTFCSTYHLYDECGKDGYITMKR